MSASSEAKAPILQRFDSLRPVRLGLPPETRSRDVQTLNRMLAWFVGERLVGNDR